jgi:hypothetical protein
MRMQVLGPFNFKLLDEVGEGAAIRYFAKIIVEIDESGAYRFKKNVPGGEEYIEWTDAPFDFSRDFRILVQNCETGALDWLIGSAATNSLKHQQCDLDGPAIYKTIRADNLAFWKDALTELTLSDESVVLPYVKRKRFHRVNGWTVKFEGVFPTNNQKRIPQYTKADFKKYFSAHQSTSYEHRNGGMQGKYFGVLREEKYISGVRFSARKIKEAEIVCSDAVEGSVDEGAGGGLSVKVAKFHQGGGGPLVNRIMPYDQGTVMRPLDFTTRDEAEACRKEMIKEKKLLPSLTALEEAHRDGSGYTELLSRLRWNADGTCQLEVYTDDRTTRLITLVRMADHKDRLMSQWREGHPRIPGFVENFNGYEPPIIFFERGEEKSHAYYTFLEREEDVRSSLISDDLYDYGLAVVFQHLSGFPMEAIKDDRESVEKILFVLSDVSDASNSKFYENCPASFKVRALECVSEKIKKGDARLLSLALFGDLRDIFKGFYIGLQSDILLSVLRDGNLLLGYKMAEIMPNILLPTFENKMTALHLSARHDFVDLAALLLSKTEEAQWVLQDSQGSTPLHEAIGMRHTKTALLFVDRYPPEAFSIQDSSGMTPLMRAMEHGTIEVAERLIERMSLNQIIISHAGLGMALHLSLLRELPELAIMLVDHCELVAFFHREHEKRWNLYRVVKKIPYLSPLELAIKHGNTEVLGKMLEAVDQHPPESLVDIYFKAMEYAVTEKKEEMLLFLLHRRAGVDSLKLRGLMRLAEATPALLLLLQRKLIQSELATQSIEEVALNTVGRTLPDRRWHHFFRPTEPTASERKARVVLNQLQELRGCAGFTEDRRSTLIAENIATHCAQAGADQAESETPLLDSTLRILYEELSTGCRFN